MFNFLKRKKLPSKIEKELLCISNKDHYIGDDFAIYVPHGYNITVGRTYKVLYEHTFHDEIFYKVTCDNGFESSYHESCFDRKNIDRERKINEILG